MKKNKKRLTDFTVNVDIKIMAHTRIEVIQKLARIMGNNKYWTGEITITPKRAR